MIGFTRPANQHGAESNQHHRQQEVLLVGKRVEVGQHHNGAHDTLHGHTQRNEHRQRGEIATARPTPERTQHRNDDHNHHDTGEQAIDLFDSAMHRRNVDKLRGVAVRPIGAAETGAAEPHSSAGDHNCEQRRQNNNSGLAIRARAHR